MHDVILNMAAGVACAWLCKRCCELLLPRVQLALRQRRSRGTGKNGARRRLSTSSGFEQDAAAWTTVAAASGRAVFNQISC